MGCAGQRRCSDCDRTQCLSDGKTNDFPDDGTLRYTREGEQAKVEERIVNAYQNLQRAGDPCRDCGSMVSKYAQSWLVQDAT